MNVSLCPQLVDLLPQAYISQLVYKVDLCKARGCDGCDHESAITKALSVCGVQIDTSEVCSNSRDESGAVSSFC